MDTLGEDIAKADVIRGGTAGRPVLAVADAPGDAVVALGDVAPGDAVVALGDIAPGDAAVRAIGPAVDHSDDIAPGDAAVRPFGGIPASPRLPGGVVFKP